jgi:two-component system cell cycle sensor histidine kinase/response regulator CckA
MPVTILIVDDEEIVRKMLRVVLTSQNTDFLEAKNATEALKIAREHRGVIDLLISDVVMPGRMNGTEMAAQLSQSRPEMKIVLMSGYPPESLTMKPAWIFIQKPFGAPEIRERVGSILTDHRVAA